MELIFSEIFKALGYLLMAGVVFFAFNIAKDSADKGKQKTVLWKGFLCCCAIALFTSLTLGDATCEEQTDPIRGGCEAYADDGYEPTIEQRVANFAYFLTLLYIPVALGAFRGNDKQLSQTLLDI